MPIRRDGFDMSWLSWLMPGRGNAAQKPGAATPIATSARIEPVDEKPLEDAQRSDTQQVLPWLLGCETLTDTPMTPIERSALDAIAKTLAKPELTDNLLPRAAALIPQLIALVRQTELPTAAIAERIGKDAVLAAEVMRLASSSHYRAQGSVANLEQAIERIGLQGLQTVIARVVLKPIFQAVPGPLSARAGKRIGDYSEALARHTAILSGRAGQAVFDAYLAGLMHGTGWTIAFSIIDRAGLHIAVPPSQAFGAALAEVAQRLFGQAAQRWDITAGFTALALDARRNGLAAALHPLAHLLRQAQQPCLEELALG
ncbi:HDOD domain-containing protein [Simplicispira sp. 110]|nr:HDOD domain-containing protein [Simplicispira sp. 110]